MLVTGLSWEPLCSWNVLISDSSHISHLSSGVTGFCFLHMPSLLKWIVQWLIWGGTIKLYQAKSGVGFFFFFGCKPNLPAMSWCWQTQIDSSVGTVLISSSGLLWKELGLCPCTLLLKAPWFKLCFKHLPWMVPSISPLLKGRPDSCFMFLPLGGSLFLSSVFLSFRLISWMHQSLWGKRRSRPQRHNPSFMVQFLYSLASLNGGSIPLKVMFWMNGVASGHFFFLFFKAVYTVPVKFRHLLIHRFCIWLSPAL